MALETATPRTFIGTPEKIADEMVRWVEEGAADGFILGFPVLGQGLDDFIRTCCPCCRNAAISTRCCPARPCATISACPIAKAAMPESATREPVRAAALMTDDGIVAPAVEGAIARRWWRCAATCTDTRS